MELLDFLNTVITTDEGYFCLAYADAKNSESETRASWKEEFFVWPTEERVIVEKIKQLGDNINVYFSPYLFSAPDSHKKFALPSRTIVADLDDANILTLHLKPTILVESSPERHQGYWILKDQLELDVHEALSKKLTYSIPRCDRTGWFKGKKVRVPGTMNLKYSTGPKFVRIVDNSGIVYKSEDLNAIPSIKELYGSDAGKFDIDEENLDWIKEATELSIGPIELLTSIRSSLPARVIAQYHVPSPDRSTALWALMTAAFTAGLSKEKVYYLAANSANNKFSDLRFGGARELAKDVLRAEMAIKIRLPDVKSKILDARNRPGKSYEISRYVSELVIEHLNKIGSFIHTSDDNAWYIREDIGKPILLMGRSEQLAILLETFFGITANEREYNYTVNVLISYVKEMPMSGQVATLSHYDIDSGTFILHTGRKDLLHVTKNAITRVTNGYAGMVFPWNLSNSGISPKYKSLDKEWDEELFEGCLDNILGISKQEARAVLKVWFLSVLLRDALISRPILACFGQPGAGKSTLFRRIYALLYGRNRSLNSVTNENEFDMAVVTDPLVVMDNVDTAYRWLPDKLAISAAPSEWTKRKLFTDADTITLKRQAMLAVTAHAPKFGREDVTDRLLILTFERLTHFQSETEIISRISELRNALWGDILKDISTILDTPVPKSGWPQFRIEDFAKFGYWIATALNIGEDFCTAIKNIRSAQKMFAIEDDMLLIDALIKMVSNDKKKLGEGKATEIPFRSPGQLMGYLPDVSGDPLTFVKRYSNAVALGKRLWTLMDALKEIFEVEWEHSKTTGSRLWRITEKRTYNTLQTHVFNEKEAQIIRNN